MKIIEQGKPQHQRKENYFGRHTCKNCQCVFEVEKDDEVYQHWDFSINIRCPNCHQLVELNPIIIQ